MATSKFIRNFKSLSNNSYLTSGTLELLPYGNTYPTGALALTHEGSGDWKRDACPDGEYSLYYNGTIHPRYQRFWVGENRQSKVADRFDANDNKALATMFKQIPAYIITSGSLSLSGNVVTINSKAFIIAPSIAKKWILLTAGTHTISGAFGLLVAVINPTTYDVSIQEWTWNSESGKTEFLPEAKYTNNVIPLVYKKAGVLYRVNFEDKYESIISQIESNDAEILLNELRLRETEDITPETISGYYDINGAVVVHTSWKCARFDVTTEKLLYISCSYGGGATYVARFFDSAGTQISALYLGVNGVISVLRKAEILIPAGTVWIGLTGSASGAFELLRPTTAYKYPLGATEVDAQIEEATGNLSTGKTIVWFGTSIPAQGYPQLVGTALGATVYNEALGSSMARAFKYDSSWVGMNYKNLLRSLSHTLAEKQHIMDNWATNLDSTGKTEAEGGTAPFTFGWRDLLAGTPPADYTTEASAATILSWSYEKKLVAKYLDITSEDFVAAPDIFILDHGHNDLANEGWDESDEAAIAVPTTRNDRSRFIGAMNYLIDVILSYNPRARIFLMGHYEKARKKRIYQAQENLFSYWDFPHIKLWEKLGWTQQEVTTTGYWENSTTWHDSGGSPQTLTMTEIWMYDDLHPASTAAKQLIANNLLSLFKNAE